MNEQTYTIGVDFGTLSGRAVLVQVEDGHEINSKVYEYPHGVLENRLPTGESLPPDWALQVPNDYLEVLKNTIPVLLEESGIDPGQVVGIGTDFTACTVLPVLKDGTPLCNLKEFENRPHAFVKLWKHHSAQSHADRINALALESNEKWLDRYGGKISSEWQFAKALQLLEEDPEIYKKMDHWVEAADWIIWQLTGTYSKNICTAGYKAIFQDNMYPTKEYLERLNPLFKNFVTEKVDWPIAQLGSKAGGLSKFGGEITGLNPGTAVAVGNVDAHVTAPAANATKAGQLVAIMGTSTCVVMVHDHLAIVPGMCGVVEGGITPSTWGYEAGQSGVGDIFGWFVNNFVGEELIQKSHKAGQDLHSYLSELAEKKPAGSHGLVALDWESGNRSTLVDHSLSGLIVGMTLATKPEDVYAALVESTAFGMRTIIEAFDSSGVPVVDFIAAGGLIKNKYVMQIYANILNRPIHIIKSEQGPALGSAIHAAVAAGEYSDIIAASEIMGGIMRDAYLPQLETVEIYNQLFHQYSKLYKSFGQGDVMHALRKIRDIVLIEKVN
jgi:L-ribulokinase